MNDDTKTTNAVGEIPVEMKSAAVGYFDENGNWQSEADRPVVMSNAPMTTARAETTPAPAPAMTGTTGRKHLPRTSSSLALFELISGLSIAGGFAVRQIRQRLS
jgi:hypothetical protein